MRGMSAAEKANVLDAMDNAAPSKPESATLETVGTKPGTNRGKVITNVVVLRVRQP